MKRVLSCCLLMVLLLCSCGGENTETAYDFSEKPKLVYAPTDSVAATETPKAESPSPAAETTAPPAEKKLSGKLRITVTNTTSKVLKSKAAEFENLYPDTKIEIDETKILTGSYTDYVRKVANGLEQGIQGDIVSFAHLPYEQLIDAGYFTDISVFMRNDPGFNKDDYYMGIINAFYNGNALFAFCTNFMDENMYVVDKALAGDLLGQYLTAPDVSFSDMLAMYDAARKKGGDYLYFMDNFNPMTLFNDMQQGFVNAQYKEARYNTDEYKRVLEYVKAAPRHPGILYTQSKAIPSAAKSLTLHPGTAYMFSNSFNLTAFFDDEASPYSTPRQITIGQDLYKFSPWEFFGITENCENKELAWEFIKFYTVLTEQDFQSTVDFWAVNGWNHVNRKAYDRYCDLLLQEQYEEMIKEMEENPAILRKMKPDAVFAAKNMLLAFTERYNTLAVPDETISSIAWKEFYLYYQDEQTLDSAASNLQERVRAYLK